MTTKKKDAAKKAAGRPKPHGSATADAILGRAAVTPKKNGPVKVKPEWAKFYNRLLELREQLIRQMNGLAKESAQEMAGYSLHMADSGTDNFDRDFALSLLSSDQDGICELTGKPIPRSRLEAIPWTRFTVQAQAQLERDGALRQRRLGVLGTVDAVGVAEVEVEEEEPEEKPKEKE